MLSDRDFANFRAKRDRFNDHPAELRLDNLPPRFEGDPVLSILMSANDFRAAQIARTLECYARQTYRSFEVLVCDNGSAVPLAPVIEQFEPHLQVRSIRMERSEFIACPTTGLKALLPLARGGIIAIQQPEVMPKPEATAYLTLAHTTDMPDVHRYKISTSRASMRGRPTWVSLKPAPLSDKITLWLDEVDWHDDLGAIDRQPNFVWNEQNFASLDIADIQARREFPYWFAGSAPREASLWEDMPTFKGHASIDLWLLNYRRENEYIDLVPHPIACYHQAHDRTSVMPADEMQASLVAPVALNLREMDMEELRGWLRCYPGCEVVDSEDVEELWTLLNDARKHDHESGSHRRSASAHLDKPVSSVAPVGDGMSVRLRRIREAYKP